MQFQFNSDNQTEGHARLAARAEDITRSRLSRVQGRLTRVEVHVADVNGPKGGAADKKCTVEVRPAGMDPITTIDHAATIDDALTGALGKALVAFDRQVGKQTTRKGH